MEFFFRGELMLHAFDRLEPKSYPLSNSLNVPILRIIQSHSEISDLKHAEVQTGHFHVPVNFKHFFQIIYTSNRSILFIFHCNTAEKEKSSTSKFIVIYIIVRIYELWLLVSENFTILAQNAADSTI
jgi:hypothetical protein